MDEVLGNSYESNVIDTRLGVPRRPGEHELWNVDITTRLEAGRRLEAGYRLSALKTPSS